MAKNKRKSQGDDDFKPLTEAEIAEIRRETDTSGMLKVVFAVFLSVAILMLAICGVATYFTIRAVIREQYTTGVVVDQTVRKDSNGNEFFYPVIEISLPEHGRTRIQLTEGNSPAAYGSGQVVNVFYDPANPDGARIAGSSGAGAGWILPVITGILGFAFLAAALFAGWMMRAKPAEPGLNEG
jgi:hypothetical protein